MYGVYYLSDFQANQPEALFVALARAVLATRLKLGQRS